MGYWNPLCSGKIMATMDWLEDKATLCSGWILDAQFIPGRASRIPLNMVKIFKSVALSVGLIGPALSVPYNTFDGEGFPACHDVSKVYHPNSVDEMIGIVKNAADTNTPVRVSGKGHMWYDTLCSDDPTTVIIQTEGVNGISDFNLAAGSVVIEAGVTFFQLAEYLHSRDASMGYTLVNWNMTISGAVAMGAHRSSLREPSMVAAGVLEIDIIDGSGTIRKVLRDESSDDWLAASTSLGLLGPIVKLKFKIYPDFKLYAQQKT
jgi:L-gulonolactone oxidase